MKDFQTNWERTKEKMFIPKEDFLIFEWKMLDFEIPIPLVKKYKKKNEDFGNLNKQIANEKMISERTFEYDVEENLKQRVLSGYYGN